MWMKHPAVTVLAETSSAAFSEVWQPKGWSAASDVEIAAFLGTVPRDNTQATSGDVSDRIAAAIAALVAGAPTALDTLGELAVALQADQGGVTTLMTAIGLRLIGVSHGSTAATARPTSTLPVVWFGTVAPTNAVTNDVWQDQSTDLWKRWSGTAWIAAGSATYEQVDIVLPMPTGVAATDQPIMDAAVAACPVGGTIKLRNGGGTPYARTTEWVINKALTIRGAGVTETTAGSAVNSPDGPLVAPYLLGSVIKQTGGGQNGITINADGKRVDLADFGIIFDTPIMHSNTGHGVLSQPSARAGGGSETGLLNAVWRNVTVMGHDGNHYAFKSINPLFGKLDHLRSIGGGGFHIESDSRYTNYGNLTAEDLHVFLYCGGTAHGYLMKAYKGLPDSAFGLLNFNVFIRPQVIASMTVALPNVTPPVQTQYLWKDEGPGYAPAGYNVAGPNDCLYVAVDLEGYNVFAGGLRHGIEFSEHNIVIPGGGVMSSNVLFRDRKRDQTLPTVTVSGGGLGTSPTLGINGSDTLGQLFLTTGTSPGGAGSACARVNYVVPRPGARVFIQPHTTQAAFQAGFFIGANDSTGFTIQTNTLLAASTLYQLFYRVERP